jgi:glycosyltransferase involved in cell wall biosynthesis
MDAVPNPPTITASADAPVPTVSIIVPTRNEARNLEVILPQLPPVHEVIVVDGRSTDDTIDTARRVMPGIIVLSQDRNGKGNAMACGFRAATGDIIVMLDADGSADPAEIPAFVAALIAGADFAKGSRFVFDPRAGSDDITALRRAGNAGLNFVANVLFRSRFTDLCYGYNAFWRRVVPMLDLPLPSIERTESMQWGDGFEIETLINCRIAAAGLTITEVPSTELRRIHGETNLRTFADGTRVLRTLVAEWIRARRRGTAPDVAVGALTAQG